MNLALNYAPKHAHGHDRADRVYLLWPAAAWRVVAPLPTDRRINILQKAVLGVCRSASYPAAEIAARLHLHPRLIEVIGMELVGSGWVDPATWRPTAKGLAMLEEEESAMESLVSGWLFQDPWTGDLWPFFARQLQLQEAAPVSDRTHVALLFDTAKGTRKSYAWNPDAPQSPGQPTTEAILTAVRRFRRREKLKGSMRLFDSGLEEPLPDGPTSMLSRIAFISDQPESAGLVTYAYVPDGGGLPPQICDPFGFGCAAEMWRHLQRIAQQDEAASGALRELLQVANAKDAPALEEHLRRQKQTAETYLIERLSLDIRTFPSVFDHLADAQHNLSLAISMGTNPQGLLAPVMGSCRKTLEALLKEVARKSPLTDADKLLTGDANLDRTTVQNIASAVGFTSPLPQKLRDSIQGQGSPNDTKKRVRDIAKSLKNVYSLQAAIVATLLACSRDIGHAFRQAAKRDPNLLSKFISIMEFGNPASHDESHSPTPRRFTVSDATQVRELTLEVAACLLNLPFRKS